MTTFSSFSGRNGGLTNKNIKHKELKRIVKNKENLSWKQRKKF